ncbi:AraC family transcriptional regulator [Rhizobium sp. NLR17b]|uniref:AraC family transcriptional regulator n=1 Tax=Rhizobium sp. NLR17b TaxID=2731114 RepID=UPI001C82AD5E|nr:AraC family transcriptional regulator [Rhizobium sp. NLR17b]MBX5273225.1 AraC family transcriptional regulator [Rhizobium sp. NLR17b]
MPDIHHYNTEQLNGANKLNAWQEYMSTVYYALDIVPASADKVRGELYEVQFPSIGLSHFKADAQKVIRHKSAAQHDKSENFVFLFPTCQKMAFEQNGRAGVVHPGSVFLLNSAEGYRIDVPDQSENVTLKISCDALRPRMSSIDNMCGTISFANPFLVPVVAQLGAQLLRFDGGRDSVKLEQSLIDLVCLMMETDSESYVTTSSYQSLVAVMRDRLMSYLCANFRDPGLNPTKAAAAHRISIRYLHRAFHQHGTTFGDALMDIRLTAACRMLQQARARKQPINFGEIGYNCGFVSQAHFSARFKERFGVSPRNFA